VLESHLPSEAIKGSPNDGVIKKSKALEIKKPLARFRAEIGKNSILDSGESEK
jgi:hypothetical protein